MRVPTTQIYLQGIEAFGQQQAKLAKLQQQISTGVRITKPSDDPVAATQVLGLEQTIQLQKQYQENISLADSRLKLEESTLVSIENITFRLKELSIQANSGVINADNRQAIASEVKQRLEELVSLANTQDANGDSLFAGYQSDTQPFATKATGSIAHVEYSGDQGSRSLQVSESRQIQVTTPGSDIFLKLSSKTALNETAATANTGTGAISPAHVFNANTYVPSNLTITFTSATTYNVSDSATPTNNITGATYTPDTDIDVGGVRFSIIGTPAAAGGDVFTVNAGQYKGIFETVQVFSNTLTDSIDGGQRAANFAEFQEDLDTFFNRVLEVRASIGGRLNTLQSQLESNESNVIVTQAALATLRDTDIAEAISQLTLEQATLDAALAVFSKITSSSLFNYLK
jgi:flagellar hook-associated protein 3 FlgL